MADGKNPSDAPPHVYPSYYGSSDTPHYGNIPIGWVWTTIGELLINRDGERKPVSLDIRNKQQDKKYDYYGAAGVIDLVDSYLFDDKLLLIGEDGANLLSRSKNNAIIAEGKFWVNNHAHVLDSTNKEILDYVAFVINTMVLDDYITGSAQPKLSQDNLNKIPIALPPLNEQQRIVAAIETWHSQIDIIDEEKSELDATIQKAKIRILDLALSGRLTSDTSHYQQLPDGWEYKQLEEVADIFDNVRIPLNAQERENRIRNKQSSELYPYYGATGQVGLVDEYLLEGKFLLLGEDGAPFLDKNAIKAYPVEGRFWVNNHAHILKPKYDFDFLMYYLNDLDYKAYVSGSTRLKLTQSAMSKIIVLLPPQQEQCRI